MSRARGTGRVTRANKRGRCLVAGRIDRCQSEFEYARGERIMPMRVEPNLTDIALFRKFRKVCEDESRLTLHSDLCAVKDGVTSVVASRDLNNERGLIVLADSAALRRGTWITQEGFDLRRWRRQEVGFRYGDLIASPRIAGGARAIRAGLRDDS